jgi:hypothetical protein
MLRAAGPARGSHWDLSKRRLALETNPMRAELVRHFDVVVVVWVLTLAIGWSFVALSHSQLSPDQWSSAPQNGPAWVVSDTTN